MADITDQDIEHVARAVFAASNWEDYPFDHSPSQDVYRRYARVALEAAAELGWGRKPTESDVAGLFLPKCVYAPEEIGHKMVRAGYAVEDPEPEWEPTEEAIQAIHDTWANASDNDDDHNRLDQPWVAVLKLIRAKPHLIGLEGE